MYNLSPFSQFELTVYNYIIPFTNFSIYLILVAGLVITYLFLITKKTLLIPGAYQILIETIYSFVLSLLFEQTGKKGIRFFPLLFTLFNFILISNLIGLFPFAFTLTAQIALTLLLALSFFIAWIIEGFTYLKLNFLKIFVPNVPLWLLPLMIVIEVLSFLIRPISLSVRLFANLLAGHILLYILSNAVLALGVVGILPFIFITLFLVLEIFIAFLQAYVFTILLCIYLSDSYKLAH